MKTLFQLFEQISRKRLLLLIHPDCCIELGSENASRYKSLLEQYAPQFDYVITHWFFEHDRSWSELWDENQKKSIKN